LAIPLLILDVLFLQLDILQLALQSLQGQIFITILSYRALEVLDTGDSGRCCLP